MISDTITNALKQRGSAMLMALLILIVLTLLGVFASSSGIMQERMSGNFRDSARAFEAAEAGARWVEAWLASLGGNRPFACAGNSCSVAEIRETNTLFSASNLPADLSNLGSAWWNTNAMAYGMIPIDNLPATSGSNTLDPTMPVPYLNQQPRLILEQIYFWDDDNDPTTTSGVNFYRVTSRATGGIQTNEAIVQSTFAKRYE